MENKKFVQAIEIINLNLCGFEVNRLFNSIGSNVFFEFGNNQEVIYPNGRRDLKKEWCIWIGDASWRLTHNGKYLVGSDDNRDDIALNIQKLLGKRFQSLQFLSSFLDVEFTFEDGYQLTTFFNWLEENQWLVFIPQRFQIESIRVDCSSSEEIKKVQSLSKNFPINEKYAEVGFSLPGHTVTAFSYDPYNRPMIHFGDNFSLEFDNCMWRLEKNGEYIFGCIDQDDVDFKGKGELSKLVGKKLLQVDSTSPMMDGRFQFEDGYVLKTFTCNHSSPQWLIASKSKSIFEANISFTED